MSTPFQRAVEVNQRHQCCAPGCARPRTRIERWCKAHVLAARRYGHPNGGPLRPHQWATERRAVADLFARNADHKGQLQALDRIAALLALGADDERRHHGAEEFARLARHGVTPLAVLTELCAVTMFLKSHPRAVPDDRSWDFAVSSAVLQLAPRPRRMTRGAGGHWPANGAPDNSQSYAPKARTSALAFIGKHLRETFAPLLVNVQHSIESRDAQQKAFEAELAAPFRAV